MRRTLALGGLTLLLGGCVNAPLQYGSNLDAARPPQIENDRTAIRDLVKQLGPPTGDVLGTDGTEIYTWTGSKVDAVYNLGVTLPWYGTTGNEQSRQSVTHTSLIATARNGVVISHDVIAKTDGEPTHTL